jgi:hypothetical protein
MLFGILDGLAYLSAMNSNLVTFAVLFLSTLSAFAQSPSDSKPQMGMNLASISDFGTETVFVDIFKTARPWISQQEGQPWGKGPKLSLDSLGYPLTIEEGCRAETPLLTDMSGHLISGIYTIFYDGDGKLTVSLGAKVVSEESGCIQIDVKGQFFLQIKETNPDNHIRNIRVIMPGFENDYAQQVFHPVFLNRWKGMACLRFMDWMRTNDSKIVKWGDRPKVESSYSTNGVPLEVMIDLCNRVKIDPWFCMPHLADDDYVRNFAQLVKEKLDPSLKPHIEYSNEVWNSMFEQTKWAQNQAIEKGIGPSERPWEGGAEFYVQRSLEIFKIWESVFGGKDRLVRILAWQAASDPKSWTDNLILGKTNGSADVDALAIAPYMNFCVPMKSENSKVPDAATVATWTVEQAMDYMNEVVLPATIEQIQKQKEVADKYSLKLMAYEAGQHMVGIQGGENNEMLTKLIHEANSNPRMGELYKKYYDAWAEASGDLVCNFSSISRWSKWGSWGVAQFFDTKPSESPKYQAVLDWAKSKGQPVTMDPWAGVAQP